MTNKQSNAHPATDEQIEKVKAALRPAQRITAPVEAATDAERAALSELHRIAVKRCGHTVTAGTVARKLGLAKTTVEWVVSNKPQKYSGEKVRLLISEYARQISDFLNFELNEINVVAEELNAINERLNQKILDIKKLIEQ